MRKEYQEINRLRRSYERQINFRLISTFSKIGSKASDAFLNNGTQGYQAISASIRNDVATTLELFYRQVILAFAKRTFTNRYSQKAIQDYEGIYKQFMQNIGGTRITEISDTTRRIISKTILDNQTAGVSEIAKAINEKMSPRFTKARASTIARTETHTASSFAIQKQAENFEAPNMRKRWVATTDDRSRGTHLAVNGTEVGIDEDFIVGGKKMKYAGDPRGGASEVINCRCVIVYIEPEDVIVDQEIPQEINTVQTASVDIKDVVFVEIRGSRTKARQQYNDLLNSQLSSLTRLAVLNNPLPERIIKKGNKGYYSEIDNELCSNLDRKTLTHEYGHHIDYELGDKTYISTTYGTKKTWSTESKEFKEAYIIDQKKLGLAPAENPFVAEIQVDILTDLKNALFASQIQEKTVTKGWAKGLKRKSRIDIPKIDGAEYISDIIDALTKGKFQKEYNAWGHGVRYYRIKGMIEKEIFANLFALNNSPQAMAFLNEKFPNLLRVFEERLKEIGN